MLVVVRRNARLRLRLSISFSRPVPGSRSAARARVAGAVVQLHRLRSSPQLEVEQFDEDGERHRKIGVALRDMEAEAFPELEADHV